MARFIYRNEGGEPIPLAVTNVTLPKSGLRRMDLRTESIEFLNAEGIYKVVEGTVPATNRFQRLTPRPYKYNAELMEAVLDYGVVDYNMDYVKSALIGEVDAHFKAALNDGFKWMGTVVDNLNQPIDNTNGVRVKIRNKDKIELSLLQQKLAEGIVPFSGWKVGVNKNIPFLNADAAAAVLNQGVIYTQEVYKQLNVAEAMAMSVESIEEAIIVSEDIVGVFDIADRWSGPVVEAPEEPTVTPPTDGGESPDDDSDSQADSEQDVDSDDGSVDDGGVDDVALDTDNNNSDTDSSGNSGADTDDVTDNDSGGSQDNTESNEGPEDTSAIDTTTPDNGLDNENPDTPEDPSAEDNSST